MSLISKNRFALATAGALAATMMSLAPAHAADLMKFADFSQDPNNGNSINVRWVNAGTGGKLFTIANPTDTLLGSAKVIFNFDLPSLSGLSHLTADYNLNVVVDSGNAAQNVGASLDQPGLHGTFSFTYTGPTTVLNGHAISNGANLLTATFFDEGDITGKKNGTAGSIFASTDSGSTITYSSDFIDFTGSTVRDLAYTLNAVKPGFGFTAGQALNGFTAAETGEFAYTAVPEPATWTISIMGFGLLGATLRRRRPQAAAATA